MVLPRLFYGFLDRFFLLEPLVEISQQEMGGKFLFGVICLEVDRHVLRSEKQVTDVTERVPLMLCQQDSSPTYPVVNIRISICPCLDIHRLPVRCPGRCRIINMYLLK